MMAGFTKLAATAITLFVLSAVTPSAMADAVLVPLDGSDKTVKPADFGYKIDIFTVNPRVIVQIVLTEEAARSFGRGRLTLTKDGETVVATTLGLDDGGDKTGLLKLTLDTRAIDGGELVVWSRPIKGQPVLANFGGFRLSIKTLLAQAKEAEGDNRQPKKGLPKTAGELKEALVGMWVSDDADRIPVEFGADGSFRLAVLMLDWKWQMAEGTYAVNDDGRVNYTAKLGGLAIRGHYTMKDGDLIGPSALDPAQRWKKVKSVNQPLREPLPPELPSSESWPGSRSSLPTLAPVTATVLAAVAKEKAEIQSGGAAHLSTQRTSGKGEVIEGGGYAFFAQCRQRFQVVEILHGKDKPGDRVLEYGFVEKTDGFPLPAVQKPIPAGAKVILLMGEKGNILKVLPDTQENREAVRTVLSDQKGKEVEPTVRLQSAQPLQAIHKGKPLVFEGLAAVPIHRPGPEHFKIARVSDAQAVPCRVAYDRDNVEHDLRGVRLRDAGPQSNFYVYNSLFKGTRLFLYNGAFSDKDPKGQAGILDLYGCPKLEAGVRYRLTWACWPVGASKAVEVSCEFELNE